ncbi:MAG: FRG domain-containing protein [Candidatus Krumholzibacteriota bacterium]|nr:FRG domain-containing protein [Candidatus Krumholzibacteriota bacterium]
MEIRELASWEEFPDAIAAVRELYGTHESMGSKVENDILFRGHSDESWTLSTTLERFSPRIWTVLDYLFVAHACAPQLESYLDISWQMPEWDEVTNTYKEEFRAQRANLPHYDYLVFLRHHGFPSPLLDWSRSAYVAAFFAYAEKADCDRVAIFAYIERPKGTKGGWVGEPKIEVMGPYVRTHRRHFQQQSWYTIASEADSETKDHKFVSHHEVVDKDPEDQDVLVKITIPQSDRQKALKNLFEYNISYFSLFQDTDSLVRMLAYKELESHDN